MDETKVRCEDCGCWGLQRKWGIECKRCDAESQLNAPLEEIRYFEKIIKQCEEERDAENKREMKRYELQITMCHGECEGADMVCSETGKWIEYENVKKLEELNHEMVKTFYRIIDLSWDRWGDETIRECCQNMIDKSRKEVQGK
jgi:hypothetical protein